MASVRKVAAAPGAKSARSLRRRQDAVTLTRLQRSAVLAVLIVATAAAYTFLPRVSDDPAVWLGVLLISAITAIPLVIAGISGRIDVLEPILLVNAGYWLYFAYAPVIDLLSRNYTFFDVFVLPLLPSGLFCAALGLASMTVGYYSSAGRAIARAAPKPPATAKTAVPYALIVLGITVLLFGAYLSTSPLSWARLLSFGQLGAGDGTFADSERVSPLANYLKSTIECFVPAFMMLFVFARSRRKLLIPLYVAILIIYTTLGFRYRVLILVVAPAVYLYLSRKRRPKLSHLLSAAVVGFLVVGVIGALRRDLRTGESPTDVEMGESIVAFNRSLAIYQPFLVTLDAFPRRHDFLWGTSFLFVLYQPIPRAIWPSKPPSPQQEIVRAAFGSDDPVSSGVAFPNIAEFYVNFGWVGVAVCMLAFGIFMRSAYEYVRCYSENQWAMLIYAVGLPFFVQLISRGYFVQTFTEAAFLLGPLTVPFWSRRINFLRRTRARPQVHPRYNVKGSTVVREAGYISGSNETG